MITIPNLPTDNLYKFKFLSGILILIFTCYIYVTQMYVIILNIDDAELNQVKYKIHKEIINKNYKLIDNEIKTFDKKFSSAYNQVYKQKLDSEQFKFNLKDKKNNRERIKFLEQHLNQLLSIDQNAKNIELLEIKLSQLQEKTDALNLQFQISIKKAELEIQKLRYLAIFLLLLLTLGICLSYKGYKEWYELVQKPNDIKLQHKINKITANNNNTFDNQL